MPSSLGLLKLPILCYGVYRNFAEMGAMSSPKRTGTQRHYWQHWSTRIIPVVWCAQPYHPGSGSHGPLFRPSVMVSETVLAVPCLWAPRTAKQLFMAATARVIWFCASSSSSSSPPPPPPPPPPSSSSSSSSYPLFKHDRVFKKAQSLWGRVKIITIWNYIKIGVTLLTEHNYHGEK